MPYTGPERRIHKVYVTRNTEYHVRKGTCVAVRDRESGSWVDAHFALRLPVAGSIKFYETGAIAAAPGLPQIGESMYFEARGRDLVTSSIVSVERPRPETVAEYGG
ncbi:MAG: hypothetical protein PVI30_00865 [Myxococcales bacterium]|jgi:hypothetical protein